MQNGILEIETKPGISCELIVFKEKIRDVDNRAALYFSSEESYLQWLKHYASSIRIEPEDKNEMVEEGFYTP